MIQMKIALAVIFLTMISLSAAGAESATDSMPGSQTQLIAPQDAREDFDLLCRALQEAHPGLYRYETKAQIKQAFETGRAKLDRPIRKIDFEVVVCQTLAAMRCGHTSMNIDIDLRAAASAAPTFPLTVMMQGQHLMVLLNNTPDDTVIRPGMEVLEINGRPVSGIVSRIEGALSADGDIQTGKSHDISGRFPFFYWFLIDPALRFSINAKDQSGHVVSTRLAGVTDAQRNAAHNPVNADMLQGIQKITPWMKQEHQVQFLDNSRIARIRFRLFMGQDFPEWLETTFKSLAEKKTQSLIIDLRKNGGGEDEFGALLVSYLTDTPFRYFDHIHMQTITPSFKEHLDWPADAETKLRAGTIADPAGGFLVTPKMHPGVAEQQPAKHPFHGKVFVLIDGGTFSTAADFCAIAAHLKLATFIGEETGGAHFGNNSGPMPSLTLPHSKLSVRFPFYGYWNAVSGDKNDRRGTLPDYPVPMTTQDIFHGVDAPMELALKFARN